MHKCTINTAVGLWLLLFPLSSFGQATMWRGACLSGIQSEVSIRAQQDTVRGPRDENLREKDTTRKPVVPQKPITGDPLLDAWLKGEEKHLPVRYKGPGYRIQIFTGGNSRADRQKARQAGLRCQTEFPELSVYTHFESPRWICRVGDFRTVEDAQHYVRQMRRKKMFRELRIVRGTVWLRR